MNKEKDEEKHKKHYHKKHLRAHRTHSPHHNRPYYEHGKDAGANEKELEEKERVLDKKEEDYDSEFKGDDSRVNVSEIKKYVETISKMKKEVSKVITGQEKVVESLISALLCDGHVLLEGVPGIAKTLAIRTLSIVSGCSAKRIQFTVDLLPSDIVGIVTYTPGKGFETLKGPIFANFLIADEINRSPSKTQSALIEAMQEMQVTIGKEKSY